MNFCPQCASKLSAKVVNQKELPVCPDEHCGFVFWNNPTPVVAAIVEYEQRILLVHNVSWPPKILGLVTGFLEAQEDPSVAVCREVKEELNLDTRSPTLIGVYPFERMNQVIIAYHVEAYGEIRLNEELDDFRLIDKDKVKPWEFGTGLAIKDYLTSITR